MKPASRRLLPLGPGELLAEAAWGGFMVVPAWNMDVAIGVARDGLHEPWTTRLVQELLRPGDRYLNAGANFGYFVCLAGRLVGAAGRVIGVEPNPHIVPFLMKSLYWNGTIGNTEVVVRALADTADEPLTFHFDPQYLGGGAPRSVSGLAGSAERDFPTPEAAHWQASTLPQMLDADGRWIKGIGLFVPFETRTATIDGIVARCGLDGLDLLHLDIEGWEAPALLGARRTIASSRRLRLITEWSAGHYAHAGPKLRDAFDATWEMLTGLGFQVRHLQPRLAADGGLFISPALDRTAMTETAPHGDYVWTRPEEDPFA
jgi:FkbM family methyltransferase